MGLYSRWMLPRLIDWTMRNDELAAYRRRLIPFARGQVLEIGVGSGLNLPLYGPEVVSILGLDSSAELLRRAEQLTAQSHHPVHLIQASAEKIPIRDCAADTVVMTWTLCSILYPARALREISRVLRPGGELLFVEHGLAPEAEVENWQDKLNPLWTRISCHLNRPVDRLIRDAGLELVELETGYMRRAPKTLAFMYEGRARLV